MKEPGLFTKIGSKLKHKKKSSNVKEENGVSNAPAEINAGAQASVSTQSADTPVNKEDRAATAELASGVDGTISSAASTGTPFGRVSVIFLKSSSEYLYCSRFSTEIKYANGIIALNNTLANLWSLIRVVSRCFNTSISQMFVSANKVFG